MQDFHDYMETKLGKPLPANDNQCLECFAIPFREAIGAKWSRFKDVSLQAKSHTEKEQTAKHKDLCNCLCKGWTKTVAAGFTTRNAKDDLWSIKVIGNSHAYTCAMVCSYVSFTYYQIYLRRWIAKKIRL
jgi:hypothetical protein